MLALLAQATVAPDPWVAIALGIIGLVGICVTAWAAVRAATRSKDVISNVGQTNGRGTLAEMISRIDTRTIETATQVAVISARFDDHRAHEKERLMKVDAALKANADNIDKVAKLIELEIVDTD